MNSSILVSPIIGGVDTHKETHTVAALDAAGRLLGTETFPVSAAGYVALVTWLRSFGRVGQVGVEGTGSYGSGLAARLRKEGIRVVEVNRPNRQLRRRRGKSDPTDAEAAARATLAGDALGVPKTQDGPVEMIRLFRLQRRSAMRARTQAANQLHAVVSTAPESMRSAVRGLSLPTLLDRIAKMRAPKPHNLASATRAVLRALALRWHQLDREVALIDEQLESLVQAVAPELVTRQGIGVEVAGALLVAAGDNPGRLHTEASFAALCGVSPLDASSGKQRRHRLNRGGNRDANRALWVVAIARLRCHSRTREYVDRRTKEGLSKPEIIRCLKRYIVREVFKILRKPRAQQSPNPLQKGLDGT
jgi:transposase